MTNPDVFHRQVDEVRSIFGDLEIIEAKTDFVVYVTAEEQENSARGDPNRCMFSNACKRAFGSKGVLFYPTVAYVDMLNPDDPSERIVMRFVLPRQTRERLEAFDMGESDVHEATFILKAVPATQTLAYKLKESRRRRKRKFAQKPLDNAEIKARREASAKKGHETRRSRALMGVRSGTGQVHTRNGDDL